MTRKLGQHDNRGKITKHHENVEKLVIGIKLDKRHMDVHHEIFGL